RRNVRARASAVANFVGRSRGLLVGSAKFSRGAQGQAWVRTDRPAGEAWKPRPPSRVGERPLFWGGRQAPAVLCGDVTKKARQSHPGGPNGDPNGIRTHV